MMQANMTSAAARAPTAKPAVTRFGGGQRQAAPSGAAAAAEAAVDRGGGVALRPAADLRRAIADDPSPVAQPAAIGFISDGGESSFTISRDAAAGTALDVPSPRAAAARVASLIVARGGEAYGLGKGPDACLALLDLMADEEVAARTDFVTFGGAPLLLALHAADAARRTAPTPTATATAAASRALDPHAVTDVRFLAWMLRPDVPARDFDDVLSVHAAAIGAAVPRRTSLPMEAVDGVVARLHALTHVVRPMRRALADAKMMAAYVAVERPLASVLARMKVEGFPVDRESAAQASEDAAALMEQLRRRAVSLVPPTVNFGNGRVGPDGFNIQSPDHCRKVLYDTLGLHTHLDAEENQTSTGKISTSEETLRILGAYHSLPLVIAEYRKIAKLRQTYFEGVFSRALVGPDGVARIHATFLQDGTDTGRLSCADPNLQNLPRGADEALGAVRRAFVPPHPETHVLVAIDYEQIELRVLAHLCGDPQLTAALASDVDACRDIHRRIAARIFNIPFAQVTSDQRSAAKRVVFGVTYGMGPKALAAQIDRPVAEARAIMGDFKRSFPGIDRFVGEVHSRCRASGGTVATILNRIRHLPDINTAAPQRRALAERQAFNTVIQGSAADIVKKAMVDVQALLDREAAAFAGVVLLSQVHDELIFACPAATVAAVAPRLRATMETCVSLKVPLIVKVSSGPTLADLTQL